MMNDETVKKFVFSKTIQDRPMNNNRGQVILEFTFCMIVILIMIYGVTKVFFWTGRDAADRRIAHDAALRNDQATPLEQISPDFYIPTKMDAIWDGN